MSRWTVGIGIPVLLLLFAGISLAQAPAPSGQNTADSLAQAAAMLDRLESRERNPEMDQKTVEKLAEQISEIVDKVLKEDPANSYAQFLQGRMFILSGRWYDARPLIEEYSRYEGRNDPLPFKLLGDIHMQGGYFKLAYPQYKKALELDPTDPTTYTALARCEASLQEFEAATSSIAKAEKLHKGENSLDLNQTIAQLAIQRASYLVQRRRAIDVEELLAGDRAMLTAIKQKKEKIGNDPDNLDLLVELLGMYDMRIQTQNLLLLSQETNPSAGPYVEIADLISRKSLVSLLLSRHTALDWIQDGIENDDIDSEGKKVLEAQVGKYTREIVQIESKLLGIHPNPEKRRAWESETPAEAKPAEPASEKGAASQS